MLLTYIDESETKSTYYLIALTADGDAIKSVEKQFAETVQIIKTKHQIPTDIEFHASDIAYGTNAWQILKGNVEASRAILERLCKIVAASGAVVHIRGIDLKTYEKYYADQNPHRPAFAFLVERIHDYVSIRGENSLVICDEIYMQKSLRTDLNRYQSTGTFGYKPRIVTEIVDTVYFAPSSTSRMLQAADLVAYVHSQWRSQHKVEKRREAYSEMWSYLLPCIKETSAWSKA